ncbi:MAG: cell wall assembly protein [Candidatus Nomurabacteria bacterium]|nr:cell wall assembly protein [Candidatus Nomurabacteria bacterium]
MIKIEGNNPATEKEIELFLKNVNFKLPEGFIDFFKKQNGASIWINDSYVDIWAIDKMFILNEEYKVNEYAPNFFLFGSNGAGEAYAVEKKTGHIFEIPFVGMSKEEALRSSSINNFNDFLV